MFEAMREAAQRLGLTLHPADPGYFDIYSTVSLTGDYQGQLVILERQASLYSFHTKVVLDPAMPVPFAITREGVVAKLARFVGLPDAQVGDKPFDKAFRVVTDDVQKLIPLLTPEVKLACYALRDHGGSFKVSDLFIEVERTFAAGQMWSADQVVQDLDPCVAAAKAFQSAVRRA